MTAVRREGPLMRGGGCVISRGSLIAIAIVVAITVSCAFAFLFSDGLFLLNFPSQDQASTKLHQITSASSEPSERTSMLKSEAASSSEKIAELKEEVRDLNMRLQLAEQRRDQAEKQVLALGVQHKAGPFGAVKAPRTNPAVIPDDSVNPRLAKMLEKVAVDKELIVALANSNVQETLRVWFENIKRVGIPNYLVVALDDDTEKFCGENDVPVYRRSLDDMFAITGRIQDVSGLKFLALREFLQLGYSVLLSDVDIVYLQNPFHHLHRDSDVESMSDGYTNKTAYGFVDVHDDPAMGWSRYAHTTRIWVYNSGFFYVRPTLPSIELLDRVAYRLSRRPELWDQTVFNEELFYPSRPGYDGLHASKRTMDMVLFMNSKVLFKMVRNNAGLRKLKPVVVHVNYHPDKVDRMKAVVEFYVGGKEDALEHFPVGSEW